MQCQCYRLLGLQNCTCIHVRMCGVDSLAHAEIQEYALVFVIGLALES